MNTNLRTILSAVTGISLGLFTIVSATARGISPDAAAFGISLLMIYALVEIGAVSNAAASSMRRRPALAVVRADAPVIRVAKPASMISPARTSAARKTRRTVVAA